MRLRLRRRVGGAGERGDESLTHCILAPPSVPNSSCLSSLGVNSGRSMCPGVPLWRGCPNSWRPTCTRWLTAFRTPATFMFVAWSAGPTSVRKSGPGNSNDPARAAATLIVVREASAGLEVLLLRRNPDLKVMAGAWVFPGGKVDADDAEAMFCPGLQRGHTGIG